MTVHLCLPHCAAQKHQVRSVFLSSVVFLCWKILGLPVGFGTYDCHSCLPSSHQPSMNLPGRHWITVPSLPCGCGFSNLFGMNHFVPILSNSQHVFMSHLVTMVEGKAPDKLSLAHHAASISTLANTLSTPEIYLASHTFPGRTTG